MQTGDGLLARIVPAESITPAAFAAFCEAARRHGNGIIEVTARGSLQVRGLSNETAPLFASEIESLNIASAGAPVVNNPLADDPTAFVDTAAMAAQLRAAIEAKRIAPAPKVSVVIDGGGRLHLDQMTADVRLRAVGPRDNVQFHVALGGDAASATPFVVVPATAAIDVALRALAVIAVRADARAADVLRSEGIAAFKKAIGNWPAAERLTPRPPPDVIGRHALRDERLACGLGLAFGHASADTLTALAKTAAACGAQSVRPAPGRVLLLIGLHPDDATALAHDAEQLGLIVRPDDPRLRVIACPGKPACASGLIAARALAGTIARNALPGADLVHVSGCRKGCAHPGAAELTIVGTARGCGIVRRGSSRAEPELYVDEASVATQAARLLRTTHEPAHV
jgi:precorrin-3B synthase